VRQPLRQRKAAEKKPGRGTSPAPLRRRSTHPKPLLPKPPLPDVHRAVTSLLLPFGKRSKLVLRVFCQNRRRSLTFKLYNKLNSKKSLLAPLSEADRPKLATSSVESFGTYEKGDTEGGIPLTQFFGYLPVRQAGFFAVKKVTRVKNAAKELD